MAGILVVTHPSSAEHDPGPGHPEAPRRLEAVQRAFEARDLAPYLEHVPARPASVAEIERVHTPAYIDAVRVVAEQGGGMLDLDTYLSSGTWNAALHAAGAGLTAVEHLPHTGDAFGFVAVRPPGHHAEPDRGMGFCIFNNLAITAAVLLERGERVLVVDWDAHHGNGTQDAFWDEPRVLFASLHEGPPLYPGSGLIHEQGGVNAPRSTLNFAFPPGTTGDRYVRALDEVVAPVVGRFDPTFVLVSCGFDAHVDDPLTDLALTSGDYAALAERVAGFAPAPGRTILFLEGGYDMGALQRSTRAVLATLAGIEVHTEPPSSGGPGGEVVDAVRELWLG